MNNIEHLLDSYHAWLRDKTVWQQIGEWAEITTPYLDRNNDYIQIYLRKQGDGFLLTDDGAIIDGLIQEGCKFESSRRREILQVLLNGYGVECDERMALRVTAEQNNFALRKHSLVQAMLAVNDMFYLAAPHVASLFFEDVKNWLEESEIRYSEDVSFAGKSGFPRKFDFIIPKSDRQPERIIKAINNPSRQSADAVIMSWLDTREQRPEESRAYALVNDDEREVAGGLPMALQNYDIKPVLWSDRDEVRAELAA